MEGASGYVRLCALGRHAPGDSFSRAIDSGIKPLYYVEAEWGIAFASELKSRCARPA